MRAPSATALMTIPTMVSLYPLHQQQLLVPRDVPSTIPMWEMRTHPTGRCFHVRHLDLRYQCTPTEQRINLDILHTNDTRIREANSRGAKQRKPNSNDPNKDRIEALRRGESGLVSGVRSGSWRPRGPRMDHDQEVDLSLYWIWIIGIVVSTSLRGNHYCSYGEAYGERARQPCPPASLLLSSE